jgi:hypothetical protein
MRVIADLHGGDLDDPVAKAEFQEIKDKVLLEVSSISRTLNSILMSMQSMFSVVQEKGDRMP